jgi:hypothetical protein
VGPTSQTGDFAVPRLFRLQGKDEQEIILKIRAVEK